MGSSSAIQTQASVDDNEVSAGGHYQSISFGGGGHEDFGGGKIPFSAGSGLKTIAQGSAQQASNAVANQHTAARQAAFVAKSSLAQAAVGVSIPTLMSRVMCYSYCPMLIGCRNSPSGSNR